MLLNKNKIPFMVGGGLAVREYGPNISREMHDVDIFCKAGDSTKIVTLMKDAGLKVVIPDARWLVEIRSGKQKLDFIFSSPNYINPVDDSWFKHSREFSLFGIKVSIIAPEELIWCKAFIQDRSRYDVPDINHIILYSGKNMDWKRLLLRMENDWELLFSILLNFRYVYPSELKVIPKWLINELINRLQNQMNHPAPIDKVCRGPLISRGDYHKDLTAEGGFETH